MHSSTMSGLAPGTAIGVCRLDRRLGEGGMGAVYSTVDTKLNRRVAIKFLSTDVARLRRDEGHGAAQHLPRSGSIAT
jgi:serine/threonine protein kinase